MKRILFVVLAVAAILISGCNKPPSVSFDTVEQARAQARENAGYNAQVFRSNSPQFDFYNVQNNGDSTQTNECPQGDGWASLNLVNPRNVRDIVGIKCSTVSAGIGCLTAEDFKKKAVYSGDEGNCQPINKVPFPLPKLAGK